MNATQAINMFLKQLELRRGLPFEVQLSVTPPTNKQRFPGLHQGPIKTSDDFDSPLDDDFWLGKDA